MATHNYNKIAGKDTGRIIAISDGVFGVALTLLVLEIRVPVMENIHSDTDLMQLFWTLKEKFLVYLLAFMTTGIFWLGHSSQYKHIGNSDRNLNWINLIFLLFVTMLPFTTAFLGDYTKFKFPIFIYWINIFMLGAMLYINWIYAVKKQFVNNETKEMVDKPLKKRIIYAQSLYFLVLYCLLSILILVLHLLFWYKQIMLLHIYLGWKRKNNRLV
jgi:uncharacterized membrane protein